MKVYLDTCSLQRPLDDQTQMRIRLEAEVVLGIIALIENDDLELISSEVLLFESRRNADTTRREDDKLLKKAKRHCAPTIKAVSPIELLKEIEQWQLESNH